MGRMFENKTATIVRNHIHDALFGHPRTAGRFGGISDDFRALSKEFSLAAPAGGGAIIAIHALGHQNCQPRTSLRE